MDQSFNVLNLRNFTKVTLFRKQDSKNKSKKYYLNGMKSGNRRHFQGTKEIHNPKTILVRKSGEFSSAYAKRSTDHFHQLDINTHAYLVFEAT